MKAKMLDEFIKKNKGDGIILFNKFNNYWLHNIETSFGITIRNLKNKMIFITDSRYIEVVKKTNKQAEVWCISSKAGFDTKSLIDKALKKLKITKLVIESDYLTINRLSLISTCKKIIQAQTNWIRAIKVNDEIKKLQKAADITAQVIKWVWTWIKPGYTEKEVAKKISIKFLELGASGNSFDPIVAAGKNGSCPHHKPSDYKIKDGDMVTIDIGCIYDHYASDMTRTFVVGKKCNKPEMVKIYNIVKESQALGIKASIVGNKTNLVDKVCRDYIDKTSYKGLFQHGTGHGVGVEVHEVPVVSPKASTVLENNHVITIEPGIYKENVGGVRIEDTIIIKNKKPIVTTESVSKELLYIYNK